MIMNPPTHQLRLGMSKRREESGTAGRRFHHARSYIGVFQVVASTVEIAASAL